ncbi:hypothetical protein PPERSA_07355 [Pseudocohnilembus persalinus]|uniref:Transmembrane protein n=1 Tax=Pseudocohnilembus persalinus TaxID=266149 RepID=A0A0V0Q8H5_PSEPJ|nr:hypothetical protein PPERSA_07355 [Pseudocohnilembus persalinus]|eukprot:KRW98541.1 hypothetical protein PPERSA_07355 [Pseudocohnilembus persalinus]
MKILAILNCSVIRLFLNQLLSSQYQFFSIPFFLQFRLISSKDSLFFGLLSSYTTYWHPSAFKSLQQKSKNKCFNFLRFSELTKFYTMFTAQLLLLIYLFSLAFSYLNSSSSKFLNLLVQANFKEASTWLSGDMFPPTKNKFKYFNFVRD